MWLLATVTDNTSPHSPTPVPLFSFSLNSLALILLEIAIVKVTNYIPVAKSNGQHLSPHMTGTNCSFRHS